jgi:phosphoribosylformylglycinamidine cyclo-ligase
VPVVVLRKRSVTYAEAGVSIEAGDRAVELLKSKVKRTTRPEVMGDLGGFSGLFRLNTRSTRARSWPRRPTASAPSW